VNFCPHCGGNLRDLAATVTPLAGEARVVEVPPTVSELLKPVPPPASRADFATDEEWHEFLAESAKRHRSDRLEAAAQAWAAEFPSLPVPEADSLLRWHLGTAKQDGAANAKALAAWRASNPDEARERTPSDRELVEWLRRTRASGINPGG
jgi:hypothetical protein